MININDKEVIPNDPAFPSETNDPSLTKREYFAIQALQGLLANPEISKFYHECQEMLMQGSGTTGRDEVTLLAVRYADKLVDALNSESSVVVTKPKGK